MPEVTVLEGTFHPTTRGLARVIATEWKRLREEDPTHYEFLVSELPPALREALDQISERNP